MSDKVRVGSMVWAEKVDIADEEMLPFMRRAALCWDTEDTKDIELDLRLVRAFAKMLRHDVEYSLREVTKQNLSQFEALGRHFKMMTDLMEAEVDGLGAIVKAVTEMMNDRSGGYDALASHDFEVLAEKIEEYRRRMN